MLVSFWDRHTVPSLQRSPRSPSQKGPTRVSRFTAYMLALTAMAFLVAVVLI
jgi:hypothetical protein